MQEITNLLDTNEKIVWESKPQFWPFFIHHTFWTGIFGLIFMIAGAFSLVQGLSEGNYLLVLFPHFWLGVLFFFGGPIHRFLVYKHYYYVITNKRVIFQNGLIGRDFKTIDFDKITNIEVTVGALDKFIGNNSGSISILTAAGAGQQTYALTSITDPYAVFKLLKQVSHDVKTDIEYPNDLRPKENPGYKTEYKVPKV